MFKTRGLGDSFFNNAKNCNISTARLSFIVLWMEINCKATLTNFTLIAGVMGRLEGLKESRGSRSNRAGPSSLFLLSETNLLRRTTKFLIEWPYPFRPSICCQRLCLCQCPKSKAVILPKSQFLKSCIYFSSISVLELSVASVQALKVRFTYFSRNKKWPNADVCILIIIQIGR